MLDYADGEAPDHRHLALARRVLSDLVHYRQGGAYEEADVIYVGKIIAGVERIGQ